MAPVTQQSHTNSPAFPDYYQVDACGCRCIGISSREEILWCDSHWGTRRRQTKRLSCGCGVYWHNDKRQDLTCDFHAEAYSKMRQERARFYVRASVVEAEQLENGRWLVRGSIFRTPTEFSDEDFRASFEQI